MKEEWRAVKHFEGRYEISNLGRVKSLGRKVNGRTLQEKVMVQCVHWKGYFVIWLRRGIVHQKYFTHRLVAEAFLPNPKGLPVVNHKDGDKKNCNLSNLEWMTFSENTRHYFDVLKLDDAIPF